MRKSKFTDEQIAFALKPAERDASVDEVCRQMGTQSAAGRLVCSSRSRRPTACA